MYMAMENPSEEPLQYFLGPQLHLAWAQREVLLLKKAALDNTLNMKQDFGNTAVLSP